MMSACTADPGSLQNLNIMNKDGSTETMLFGVAALQLSTNLESDDSTNRLKLALGSLKRPRKSNEVDAVLVPLHWP
jgi:hypothetical protein